MKREVFNYVSFLFKTNNAYALYACVSASSKQNHDASFTLCRCMHSQNAAVEVINMGEGRQSRFVTATPFDR